MLEINERKCAEFTLRTSEELTRRIIESSRDCIKVLDLEGNLLFMSRGGQELLEIDDIQDYLDKCWINFWQPEDRPTARAAIAAARAGGTGRFQAFCPSVKGAPRWWESVTTPLCNADGQPEQLLSVSRDITDRTVAEALLAGEKRILEMVASGDSLPNILNSICQLVEQHARDALTSILLVEDGRLRHVGRPSLAQAYVDAIDGIAIGPRVGSCGTAAYFAKQVIVSDIMTDPLWDGIREVALPLFHSLRAVWSNPIISSEGKVIGTFAMYYREPRSPTVRDQQLIEQITHLAGVAIQARETERRYREMQMELAHANRVATMGQLTALIAHEVRQPITASITNAQAARRWLDRQTPDVEEAQKALDSVTNDGKRASAIIDRISNLVKKVPPRKERMEINAAIREVIELIRSEVVKNSVSVEMRLAEALPLIGGDRVQLQQVIMNLTINAIQAMSASSDEPRKLVISTEKDAHSSSVRVAVRDSGPGLAPDTLERAFDAFHSTKPEGLGLGLSICRSIIEGHGGQLWASANEPRGAALEFTLPGE